MARTPSTMVPLGTPAPSFRLPDPASGVHVTLEDFEPAPGLLVVFLCNHCPFVKHIREGLAAFARDYVAKGLAIVGINANDVTAYPDDRPEMMVEEAKQAGYVFPYLFDETQEIARAYDAACTPDFFLFDAERKLVYRGQFDASRPGNGVPVTGSDLRAACDALLAGKPLPPDQTPSIGCNIKWKLH
jgi:thiol-disulfide isomerase/thioredoxin